MRFAAILTTAAFGLILLPSAQSGQLTGRPVGPEPPKPPAAVSCGSYGTTVDFVDSPSDAAKQAAKEQKLVLVLHVSGQFEDSGLT
jgi:hypothetical protein